MTARPFLPCALTLAAALCCVSPGLLDGAARRAPHPLEGVYRFQAPGTVGTYVLEVRRDGFAVARGTPIFVAQDVVRGDGSVVSVNVGPPRRTVWTGRWEPSGPGLRITLASSERPEWTFHLRRFAEGTFGWRRELQEPGDVPFPAEARDGDEQIWFERVQDRAGRRHQTLRLGVDVAKASP